MLWLRISNGYSAASAPFTASDGASLRAACARALADGPVSRGELQVRDDHGDWYAPVLVGEPAGYNNGAYVRVLVDERLLDRRPPDDWNSVFSWCVASHEHGRRLDAFARDVADDAIDNTDLQQ